MLHDHDPQICLNCALLWTHIILLRKYMLNAFTTCCGALRAAAKDCGAVSSDVSLSSTTLLACAGSGLASAQDWESAELHQNAGAHRHQLLHESPVEKERVKTNAVR